MLLIEKNLKMSAFVPFMKENSLCFVIKCDSIHEKLYEDGVELLHNSIYKILKGMI